MSVYADGYKSYTTTLVVSGNTKKDITLQSENTGSSTVSSSKSKSASPPMWLYGVIALIIVGIIVGVAIGLAARKKNKNEGPREEFPPPAWESEQEPEMKKETDQESTEENNGIVEPIPTTPEEPEIKYCPNCGHEVKPEWKVCPYCGYKLKKD